MSNFDTEKGYELFRDYSLSPDKLYGVLTDSSVLKEIWGVQQITVDARVGGITRAVYIEGNVDWSFDITYKEVEPGKKLSWITHFKQFPSKETRVTILFKESDKGTKLVVRMENFENAVERDANRKAWEQGLTKLEAVLKKY